MKEKGFTLIEVLVALIILAIALVGVMATIGSSIRMSERVRDDTAAHFVAMNVIAKMQINTLPSPSGNGLSSGNSRMMGVNWYWQVSTVKQASHADLIKVVVAKKLDGPSFASLVGYVWSKKNAST